MIILYILVCLLCNLCRVFSSSIHLFSRPGLHCYSCYGIGPNNPCENYTSYEKAWDDRHLPEQHQTNKVHLKTCAWPYNVTCIINTFVSNTGIFPTQVSCRDYSVYKCTSETRNLIPQFVLT